MSKIKEQARVIVIQNGEIRRGTVGKIFPELGTAIVGFDDESIEKVELKDIALEPVAEPTEKEEPKKTAEPVEKSEITITPNEFKKIASKEIAEHIKKMGEGGGLLGLTFTIFVAGLHRKLFFDVVDND